MLCYRSLIKIKQFRGCLCGSRLFSLKTKYDSNQKKTDDSEGRLGDMGTKYKIFQEENAPQILDVNEEKFKYSQLLEEQEAALDPLDGLNLKRGIAGVFDIEDLVDVLKRENAEDIFVASVPKNINYVDYICIVSGKSKRHMQAIIQFVRKVFKKKRSEQDSVPIAEGKDSEEWIALDLGNIALHVFSKQARLHYDLESLWSVGPKFDKECMKQDEIAAMLEKHSFSLDDLQAAS